MIPTTRLQNRPRRGFTIAEILVVLVIIAFASTVSLLAYSNYRKGATVRSAAEMVKRTMVDARYRAIAEGQTARLVFDLTHQAFWIDIVDGGGQVVTPMALPPTTFGLDVVMESVQIQGIVATTDQIAADFKADGTNPLTKVHLRREADDPNLDESYFTVQIYPSSAEPHIWPNTRR
ncbi:MAG: prepilin-type N-terminal cleavage/methylation domain-containing protein [Candidatus Sumerlaeia bacterium]|nr:prepilin-type N-terminal cleavage/methylation domain-containing protein [Candidatus Sumerlaeia bacterium]